MSISLKHTIRNQTLFLKNRSKIISQLKFETKKSRKIYDYLKSDQAFKYQTDKSHGEIMLNEMREFKIKSIKFRLGSMTLR